MNESNTNMQGVGAGSGKINPGIVSYEILDKATLYAAYMPFIKNGGLFVASDLPYKLGDELSVSIQLIDESPRMVILGKVVWITPAHAQGNRKQGVGIQFNEEDAEGIRNKIETYLAGALQSDRSTDTL